jgi:hypothetical protein
MWNTEGQLIAQKPPGAQNWAIGHVGEHRLGYGQEREQGGWYSHNRHVTPESLYLKQLEDRLGEAAVADIAYQSVDYGTIPVFREGELNIGGYGVERTGGRVTVSLTGLNLSSREERVTLVLAEYESGKLLRLHIDARTALKGEYLDLQCTLEDDQTQTHIFKAMTVSGIENLVPLKAAWVRINA